MSEGGAAPAGPRAAIELAPLPALGPACLLHALPTLRVKPDPLHPAERRHLDEAEEEQQTGAVHQVPPPHQTLGARSKQLHVPNPPQVGIVPDIEDFSTIQPKN
ncbi:hypothetical protein BS78_01G257600 [Paspalum vaginatum]|nr:hypothetical protein BS78_01G257600 [Paspalum vaginatum]